MAKYDDERISVGHDRENEKVSAGSGNGSTGHVFFASQSSQDNYEYNDYLNSVEREREKEEKERRMRRSEEQNHDHGSNEKRVSDDDGKASADLSIKAPLTQRGADVLSDDLRHGRNVTSGGRFDALTQNRDANVNYSVEARARNSTQRVAENSNVTVGSSTSPEGNVSVGRRDSHTSQNDHVTVEKSSKENEKVSYSGENSVEGSGRVTVVKSRGTADTDEKITVNDGKKNRAERNYGTENRPLNSRLFGFSGIKGLAGDPSGSLFFRDQLSNSEEPELSDRTKKILSKSAHSPGSKAGTTPAQKLSSGQVTETDGTTYGEKSDSSKKASPRKISDKTKGAFTDTGIDKISTGEPHSEKEESENKPGHTKSTPEPEGENSKVSALSKFRGEKNPKVTAGTNIKSKKVKAGLLAKFGARNSADTLSAKGVEEAATASASRSTGKKGKGGQANSTKKSAGALLGATLLSAATPFGAMILVVAIICIVVINALTYIFGASIYDSYQNLIASENRYDGGYDQMTYLVTKYGLSDTELYSYNLKNVSIAGDNCVFDLERSPVLDSARLSKLYSTKNGKVTEQRVLDNVEFMAEDFDRNTPSDYAVFWYGLADVRARTSDDGAEIFAENYEDLIKHFVDEYKGEEEESTGFWSMIDYALWNFDNTPQIYVLSIVDTSAADPQRDATQSEVIEKYNDALRKMCTRHDKWCFVDITSLADENSYKEDGQSYTDSFYRLCLLPYLSKITHNAYSLGRSIYSTFGHTYGIYGLTVNDSLYELIEYLYKQKNNDDGVYDRFRGYVDARRESFGAEMVQETFEEDWELVFDRNNELNYEKMYSDQQAFIVEAYYKERIKPYLENTYGLDISGASYAFKAAILSIAMEYAYDSSDSFFYNRVTPAFAGFFEDVDWMTLESNVINDLYDHAVAIDPGHADRWNSEREDCLSMFNGTLNLYEASWNDDGFINWEPHLDEDRNPPEDLIKLAPEDSHGTGIIKYMTRYVYDHEEEGGETAQAYVEYALSFADDPSMYGKGVYKLPYVWGGASLVTGADCSGFVGQILATYGYLDQATANCHGYCSGNFRTLGTAVDISDIRVGDVVCYEGHVAIYIGGGQIVHEPSKSRSCGVEVGNLYVVPVVAVRRFDMTEPRHQDITAEDRYENCDFLGDSRTKSLSEGGTYAYELLPSDSVHATWGGTLTTAINDVNASRTDAEVAFFWYGINDVGLGNTKPLSEELETFRTNYLHVLDKYVEHNPSVKYIRIISILDTAKTDNTWTPEQSSRIQQYNAVLKEICRERGYTYIDITSLYSETETGGTGGLVDNIHFSKKWYKNEFLPLIDYYTY